MLLGGSGDKGSNPGLALVLIAISYSATKVWKPTTMKVTAKTVVKACRPLMDFDLDGKKEKGNGLLNIRV